MSGFYETIEQELSLSELQSRIRLSVPRTVITKVEKLKTQVEAINAKSIQKLSAEQRAQLKTTIETLASLLAQKRQKSNS